MTKELLEKGRIRHGLFFAHLAVEKMLKSHVTRSTQGVAPRIHNLVRLAGLTGLSRSPEQLDFLERPNPYQLEGRYPDDLGQVRVTEEDARELLSATEDALRWLTAQS